MLRAGQKRLKTPEVAASRGADDGCLSPPGLRSWSGGTPGDSAALPVPARTCCLARRWQCPILFWVPLSAPHPKGGGRVGVGCQRPAGPVGPGALAVRGARHPRQPALPGLGHLWAAGAVSLQAHKYCSTSVTERTVRAARGPLRVSRYPFPDCVPHAPSPVRWTVSPDPMHPPRSRGQVDRISELARKLGRKRGSGTCRFRAGEAAGVRMEPGRSGA